MIRVDKQKLKLLSVLLTFSFILINVSHPVLAQIPLTQKDIDRINRNENYRDPEEPTISTGCSEVAGTFASVYMIGDSITASVQSSLNRLFQEGGAESEIDGLSSRRLSTGNSELDGISVIQNSTSSYEEVDAIIIALGTNGGITESNVADTINFVKDVNDTAKIFWVNVGVNNNLRRTALPADSWNSILKAQSEKLGFSIINWADVVKADSESSGLIISSDGLGVHLTNEGVELYTQLIKQNILAGNSDISVCSTELTGGDNPEKVWNFMISKGLQPFQVAGFMGNMQAEAGFEPRRTEYAWSDPPHLSDVVPPCANDKCQPGYGIVQWTAKSRKDGLANFALQRGVIAGDLGLQLEYVWEEINGACCGLKESFRNKYGNVTVLEALKRTETVEEATDLILRNYEIPADMDKAYLVRIGFANAWLVRFGSGGS